MASRQCTPASEDGTSSPARLTPNSKVQAMLAALDRESDEESVSGSARTRLLSAITKKSPSKASNGLPTKSSTDVTESASAEGLDSDEDEEIVRPKGRMAARMLANVEESDEDIVSAVNARERVKKSPRTKSKSLEPTTNDNAEAGDASDESHTQIVSRKRRIRKHRSTPTPSPVRRSASPGLFVSPKKQGSASPTNNDSDSDELPASVGSGDRFKALVEKKRQERLARDAEQQKEKAKRDAARKLHSDMLEADENDSDDEGGRRLTQQNRPTRKASKKAIEEMHRETQRMARNLQLAHMATTKKKFPKNGLFAKFGYASDKVKAENVVEPVRPTSSSSAAPHSDVEMKDTPPTSPASQAEEEKTGRPTLLALDGNNEVLPALDDTLAQISSSPQKRLDKGKGRAVEEHIPSSPLTGVEKNKGGVIKKVAEEYRQTRKVSKEPVFKQKPIRVQPPKPEDRQASVMDDSDSDLEIVSETTLLRNKKLNAIFDRVPTKQAQQSRSVHVMRMLANLTSPNKQHVGKNKKPSMTTTELQMSLQQRARQQAAREREERLQALKAKGIVIQTSEEREKEMAEVDDLLAKARQEDEALRTKEKAAAKKERKENGEVDPLGDSSDDEDWEEGKQEAEVEVSGSEDEEAEPIFSGDEEDEEEEEEDTMALDDQDEEAKAANPMFDEEAETSDEEEVDAELSLDEDMAEDGDLDEEAEQEISVPKQQGRRVRKSNVISDDEDEGSNELQQEKKTPTLLQVDSPAQVTTKSPLAPNSVLRSATKTFIPGVTVAGPAGLGLTQIFAGTMDESQMDASQDSPTVQDSPLVQTQQNNLAFLRRLPAPTLPPFIPTMEDTQDIDANEESQQSHIPESQPTQMVDIHMSQSQFHGFDSLVSNTQLSQFPEATQDEGFAMMTPIKGRFVDAPPSTRDTLVLEPNAVPETMEETPIVKKKGKLRQRVQLAAFSDEEDEAEPINMDEDLDITENIFDVMRKASKKKAVVVDEFDKKNSKAKEMVQEQADESEDEYAGLGGASDDESGGEEDALIKEMIDDEGGKDVDESKLAAFFADRERASDEKQVEKLYNDITKGMLRRKRGADYDLSDSDDGGEARQRMKRKEFAKMRKALLADERIGKIAENPKRQAFLRAIEDRGSEDEMDFLDDFAEPEEELQSQSQAEGSQQVIPSSQPTEIGPPKRKRSDEAAEAAMRPPPHLRRTGKKPSNISEIRESLSSLIEEPNSVIADVVSDSDDDLEIEGEAPRQDKENRDPFALRRSNVQIVDRISLKRQSSSSISNSTRMAFSTSSTSAFKVPALLRRATTNNSIASSTSSSVSGGMACVGGSEGGDGVKRGGKKNSGIHFAARENERKAGLQKTEKRREQKLVKGAEKRRRVVGGLFGGGKFE